MANGIRDILSHYAIDSMEILRSKGKGNLLVTDPQSLQNGNISANLMEVPWGSIEQLGDYKWLPQTTTEATVHFGCDLFVQQQVLNSTMILLYDYELDIEQPKMIFQLKPTQKSFISTWYNGCTLAHWTFNLCCGGYGGWEYAFQTAEDFGWPHHYTIGVDHSLPAAAQHSINHQTQLVPNVQIGSSFIADRHKSTTICAPIQAQGWRQAVAMINPQIWSFSFPCQSWTSAAWSQGFLDDNGKVLLEGMGLARVLRPAIILLENVKNFSKHQHYTDFCQVVHWCGYRFLHQAVVDAQERIPCVRPRWLAILERIEENHHPFNWPKWDIKKQNLLSWGCHMKSTQDEIDEFRIPPDVVKKYMDPSYLPVHAPYWAKNNLLNYRAVPLQNKMPVVMAAYGRQHELREDLLQSRGLFGHFTAEECKFRWWKPIELALAHMQNAPMALLRPKENAWQIIGNCIIQHHALVSVYAAFDHVYGPISHSFEHVLTTLEENRMKPDTLQVKTDQFAWYLGPEQKTKATQKYVQLIAKEMEWGTSKTVKWPQNCFFDFEQGCIPFDGHKSSDECHIITPTCPFTDPVGEPVQQLSQDVNSPLDSPAEPIWDNLDCDLKKHFNVAITEATTERSHEDFEKESQLSLSPMKQDEYQIDSDEPMLSEPEQACTDEQLQKTLKEFLVPMEIEKVETEVETKEVAYMVTPLLDPGNYSALCILDDIPSIELTKLWDHRVALIHPERYCQQASGHEVFCDVNEPVQTGCLAPIMQETSYYRKASMISQHEKLLLFDIAGQTYAQKIGKQAIPNLQKFPKKVQVFEWYDEIGSVDTLKPTSSMRVFAEQVEHGTCFDIKEIIQAMTKVTYETRIPSTSDVLVCQFRGHVDDLAKVLTFWQIAIDSPWITKHSRAVVRQIVDPTCVQLSFVPRGNAFATPISILRKAIETKLLITLFNSLRDPRGDNCQIVFKADSRDFPPFDIFKGFPWQNILEAICHIYTINEFGLQPSIVHAGKRVCAETIGESVCKPESKQTKFHIVRPVMGGTGSKVEHKQAVHAGLSSLLMDHGVSFKQVPEAITTMIQQFGLPRLTHLLFGEEASKRESIFRDLCQQSSVHLPAKSGSSTKSKAKFQKLGSEKNAHEMRNLDVSRYQLKPGFFLTSQGQPLHIAAEFSPCVPSVTMMTAENAKQWISQAGKLLPVELAIFIVGELDTPNIPLQQLVVPAVNFDGQQCLIAGYLLQLGDKQVTVATDEGALIQTHDVQICSFTMWKQDFTQEEWQEAIKSPVRFSKQLLAKDALDDTIRSPFGRAFRKESKPCNPADSTSIQYHSEVKLADLRKLLRRSGFNRLFVTPKTTNGKPSDQWRVIWLPQTIQQLEAMCLTQACTAGLIRGRKSQGIRVESSHFEEMWDKIHPGVQPPKKTPQGDIYKLQPLPFGVDRDVLQEWADSNHWEMHPVRPLGAKTWLVNSSSLPPKEVMFFNSSPLLITKMPPKNQEKPVGLIAGPRSTSAALTVPPVKNPTVFHKGDPFLDPWQAAAPSTAKVESGPTEKYLQQHDQQIKSLEQAVQDLQVMAKENNKQQDEKFQKMETQIQNHANQTQAVLHSFESSLAQALSQQENRITTSMDELKQLLLRKDKRSRASSDDIAEG